VEILEDHEQWLDLALSQEKALTGVQGSLAALRGIERLPLGILDRHVKEGQEGRACRFECPIKGEELVCYLLMHLPRVVPALDLTVGLEEIDDREVAGGFAVRHGARFQDEPPLIADRAGELMEESRLAYARLSYDGDELAVPLTGEIECPADLLDLRVSAYEPGQSARDACLEPSPHPRARQHVDLDRFG
jgi:hypothetical protein